MFFLFHQQILIVRMLVFTDKGDQTCHISFLPFSLSHRTHLWWIFWLFWFFFFFFCFIFSFLGYVFIRISVVGWLIFLVCRCFVKGAPVAAIWLEEMVKKRKEKGAPRTVKKRKKKTSHMWRENVSINFKTNYQKLLMWKKD